MGLRPSKLVVITYHKNLVQYLYTVLEKSPKKYRFTIVDKLMREASEITEHLYLANSYDISDERRIEQQRLIQVHYQILDYYIELAKDFRCITFHQFKVLSEKMGACLKLFIAWKKSEDAKRSSLMIQEGGN